MRLTDTHVHLTDRRFDRDRQAVLERARRAGVLRMINVGADPASSRAAVALAVEHEGIWATVGVHPHYVDALEEPAWDGLAELAARPDVVAVGETGLDFYRDLSPRPVQHEAFERHLDLAETLGKPAVIHTRDAQREVLEHLAARRGRLRAVLHCYSGGGEALGAALDLGLYISIAGPITYGAGGPLWEVARAVPEDRLLIETDCPYLTPAPLRGKRNEPAYITLVAEAVAEARGVAAEELAEVTFVNAESFFGLA